LQRAGKRIERDVARQSRQADKHHSLDPRFRSGWRPIDKACRDNIKPNCSGDCYFVTAKTSWSNKQKPVATFGEIQLRDIVSKALHQATAYTMQATLSERPNATADCMITANPRPAADPRYEQQIPA